MDTSDPNNNQVPSWFAEASTPITTPPPRTNPIQKKTVLRVSIGLASILVIAASVIAYMMYVQNEKQSIAKDFRDTYLGFYMTFSSIDDPLEPEGIDPVDIAEQWQAYNSAVESLKSSVLYPDQKDIISAIQSINSDYAQFITNTVPRLTQYITGCTYSKEAGLSDVSDLCITSLQAIVNSSDSTAKPTATQLLAILSNAKARGTITDTDIADAGTLEEKLMASIQDDFDTASSAQITQLGKNVGLDFTTE